MTTIDSAAPPRGTPRLVYRPQGDKTLVYNPVTDELHLLSKLGADILRQCDGTRSAAELAAKAFPPDSPGAGFAERLFDRYLDELRRRKLVDATPASTVDGEAP